MRPYWHFCGMVAAASLPPSSGSPPMQTPSAPDNQGMDVFVDPRERR
jgi:hypothetical protein